MAAEIQWHIRISILQPVRHTDILGAIMDIHFRDDSPEAVIAVVIALDENKLPV